MEFRRPLSRRAVLAGAANGFGALAFRALLGQAAQAAPGSPATRPLAAAASTIERASAALVASGFSTSACLPALSASTNRSWCR